MLGYEDFLEDMYCILMVVDLVLMVIDGVKGVEDCIVKLMEVCCMCDILIILFVNKMDCEICEFLELLDEIENVFKIKCVLIIWLFGIGCDFVGVFNLIEEKFYVYKVGFGLIIIEIEVCDGYDYLDLCEKVGELVWVVFEEFLELV